MRWSIGIVVATACGPENYAPGPSPCTEEDLALTPGTGAEGFERLADGDHVTIWHGPQGGWHVETAGFMEHSDYDVSVAGELRSDALGVVSAGGTPVFTELVHEADSCEGAFYGVKTYVGAKEAGDADDQAFVCGLADQPLTFAITAGTIDGSRTTTSEVQVVVDLDPDDIPLCR